MADIPKIRFKGFMEDWERRKLGELVHFSKGTGYSKADLKETGTPIILYGRLYTKYETVIRDVDTYADARNGSVYSRGGEVIVPASGETAEDISVASVVERSGVLLGGDLNIITPPADLDSAFLAISISNGKPHDDMAKMAQGKSVVHLHNADLEKIDLMYPCYTEQRQVSACFKNLDHLITLHQRKCDETKELKKYMLQKMFPQNGKKIPEIRFAGFTDEWKQRKLGEVAISIKNGFAYKADGNRSHRYKITRIESISAGEINTEKLGSSNSIDESYKLLEGDILFSHINSLPYIANTAIYTNDLGEIYHGMNLINIRVNKDLIMPYFLFHLLKREDKRDWFRTVAKPAVNQCSVAIADIVKFPFLMPNIVEQQQIGNFFSNLDNLITLHQRKCEELKEVKKFMLQNMFPQKG